MASCSLLIGRRICAGLNTGSILLHNSAWTRTLVDLMVQHANADAFKALRPVRPTPPRSFPISNVNALKAESSVRARCASTQKVPLAGIQADLTLGRAENREGAGASASEADCRASVC